MPHPLQHIASAVGDLSGATFRHGAERTLSDHPSPELQRLTAETVEFALQKLWDGGVLVPVVTWTGAREPGASETAHQRRMFGDPSRIDTDLNHGLQMARAFVDAFNVDHVTRYAWVYDGYAGQGNHEAVIVEASEADRSHGWLLAARYRFSKRGVSLVDRDLMELGAIRTPFTA